MSWLELSGARPLVCYVTDRRAFGVREPEATGRLLEAISRARDAGADAVQLREKDLSARALLELAQAAIARAASIVVNDRLDVALAAGAAGVHLGGESAPVAGVAAFRDAGRAPGGFLIGRSCHSLEEVLAAQHDGADYAFFGPVFATPSKERFGPPQGIAALAAVCSRARIPVFAIGGIRAENARECAAAGAAGIAAIRMFQEGADLTALVQDLKRR